MRRFLFSLQSFFLFICSSVKSNVVYIALFRFSHYLVSFLSIISFVFITALWAHNTRVRTRTHAQARTHTHTHTTHIHRCAHIQRTHTRTHTYVHSFTLRIQFMIVYYKVHQRSVLGSALQELYSREHAAYAHTQQLVSEYGFKWYCHKADSLGFSGIRCFVVSKPKVL